MPVTKTFTDSRKCLLNEILSTYADRGQGQLSVEDVGSRSCRSISMLSKRHLLSFSSVRTGRRSGSFSSMLSTYPGMKYTTSPVQG